MNLAKIDDCAFRFRNDLLGDGENDGTVDRLLVFFRRVANQRGEIVAAIALPECLRARLFRCACGSQKGRNVAIVRSGKKFGHIFRRVDIKHQTRKAQNVGGNVFQARLIEMRATTTRAEAAFDNVGRSAHQRIRAGSVAEGTTNHPRPRGSSKAAEIGRCNQRDVDRDKQNCRSSHLDRAQTRRVCRNAVTHLLVLFKDQRAGATRVFGDVRIAGYHDHSIDALGLT